MSDVLEEFKFKNNNKLAPTWVGWSACLAYLLICVSALVDIFYIYWGMFTVTLLVSLIVGLSLVCFCIYISGHYEWEIKRKFEQHKSGFFYYSFYYTVTVFGSGKSEVIIKSISEISDRGTYLLIKGNLTKSESPTKPVKLNVFKLRLDFEDNETVKKVLFDSISTSAKEEN